MTISGLLQGLDKILFPVIDCQVSPQLRAGTAFFIATGGGEHFHPHRMGQLNCRRADAGRAAVDQQGLTCSQIRAMDQVTPYSEKRFRQCRSLHHGQPFGRRQALPLRCQRVFRVSATIGQCANPVANNIAFNARAYRGNLARHLQPENRRGTGRGRVKTRALNNIRAIDTSSGHADQYFSRLWSGFVPLSNHQFFRATVFRQINKSHVSSPYPEKRL